MAFVATARRLPRNPPCRPCSPRSAGATSSPGCHWARSARPTRRPWPKASSAPGWGPGWPPTWRMPVGTRCSCGRCSSPCVPAGCCTAPRRGRWTWPGNQDRPALPAAIVSHLGMLSDTTRHLLTVGAVLGTSFDAGNLAELAGATPQAMVAVLDESRVAGVVTDAARGQVAFSHDLLRESLYDTIPAALRGQLHAAAARLLARHGAPAATVLAHLTRARPQRSDAGWVGELAWEILHTDPVTATTLFRTQLELRRRRRQRVRRARRRAVPGRPGRRRVASHLCRPAPAGRAAARRAGGCPPLGRSAPRPRGLPCLPGLQLDRPGRRRPPRRPRRPRWRARRASGRLAPRPRRRAGHGHRDARP